MPTRENLKESDTRYRPPNLRLPGCPPIPLTPLYEGGGMLPRSPRGSIHGASFRSTGRRPQQRPTTQRQRKAYIAACPSGTQSSVGMVPPFSAALCIAAWLHPARPTTSTIILLRGGVLTPRSPSRCPRSMGCLIWLVIPTPLGVHATDRPPRGYYRLGRQGRSLPLGETQEAGAQELGSA